MRFRARECAALLAVLLVTGCMHQGEEVSIPPLSPAGGRVDPGLGPEAQPLSSGPGYKGSPSWSPQGDRIAFSVDGYVVDESLDAGDARRWTTRDFVAEDVEWTSESSLTIFGAANPPSGTDGMSVYRARSEQGSLGVKEIATKVLAMSPGPGGESMIVVRKTGPYGSGLVLMHDNGVIDRIYTSTIEGRVTGISLSPDRRKAALAVRTPGDLFELHTFDLRRGAHRKIARLAEGLEIVGEPQWTKRGICYVVGKEETSGVENAAPLYDLYSILPDSGRPEPTPGVGEDFVASSIRVSPDGKRLAVIGRLNPTAPAAEDLEAVTTNEDMEIKTGPGDLAWSPGGRSVAIVARRANSEEPVVRAAPKGALLEDFYNLYEIPIEDQGEMGR